MLENTSECSALSSSLSDKKVNNKGMIQKVFMYIVLLFAFLMVGVFQSNENIKAETWYEEGCSVEWNDAYCDDSSGISDEKLRIYMIHTNGLFDSVKPQRLTFKICPYGDGASSSCKEFSLYAGNYIRGENIFAIDLRIYKDGSYMYDYQYDSGREWSEKQYSSKSLLDEISYYGSTYESQGFRIEACGYHQNKNEWNKGVYNHTMAAGFDVGAYYFTKPPITVGASTGYKKSHSSSISVGKGTQTIIYKHYWWMDRTCDQVNLSLSSATATTGTGNCYVGGTKVASYTSYQVTSSPAKKSSGTGTYYLIVYACSSYNNCNVGKNTFYFDNTAPAFSSFSDSDGDTADKKGYNITATFTEALTSVGATEYCWNTSSTASSVSSCVSTTSSISGVTGTYYLHARARDTTPKGSGGSTADYNWSSWRVSSGFDLDNTTPTFSSFSDADGSSTWSKAYNVTATFTDANSGIGSTYYCWNTSSTASTVTNCVSETSSLAPSASGIYYLHARARDKSLKGTQSSDYNYSGWKVSSAFYVDVVAPTVKTALSPNGNNAYVKSVSVSITYEDDKSGVGAIQYCWTTSSTATSCSSPQSATVSSGSASISSGTNAGEYYLLVRARDNSVKGAASSNYNYTSWAKSNLFYLGVAQIGNTEYHTLADAITGASDNNTIKMLNSVTECVSNSKTITLNLNGKTISCATTAITNSGTLTITGAGTIKTTATSGYRYGINNSGTLTINSGTISSDTKNVDTIRAVYNSGSITVADGTLDGGHGLRNDGTMTITGGTITGYYYGINTQSTTESTISGATISGTKDDGKGIYAASSGKVVINSGTITGGANGLFLTGTSIIEVKGGTISGSQYGIYNATGTLTVSGGAISSSNTSTSLYYYGIYNNSGGAVSVSGSSTTVHGLMGGIVNYGTLTISGGTITSDNHVAVYHENADKTTSISGATISGAYGVYNKSGTVTINSGTISGNTNGAYNAGTMNVNGGTIVGTTNLNDNKGGGISNIGGTLSVTGGNISSNGSSGIYATTGTVTVSGGVIGIVVDDSTTYISENGIYGFGGVTINVSSTAIVHGSTYGVTHDSGALNISGGTIGTVAIDSTTYSSVHGAYQWWSGAVTISGGTISGTENGYRHISQGTLTITGGTFNGEIRGVVIQKSNNTGTIGLATISGGTFTGWHGLVLFDDTRAVVNGGTFTGGDNGIYTSSTSTSALTVTNGTINGTNNGIYMNNGTVSISGGIISGGTNGLNNNGATLNVTGGTIYSTGNGSQGVNNYSGTLTVSGGTIGTATVSGTTYTSTYGINNASTVNVSGGTVTGTGNSVTNTGTVNVTDGTIRGSSIGIENSGTLTISGGTVEGNDRGLNNTGTATISGGSVSAAINDGTGNLTVSGGTVSGYNYGITNTSSGTVTISGGTISSTNAEGADTGAIKTSAGKVIIGVNNSTISTSSPVITSAGGFGIYETNSAASVEVYDGIIKGKYNSDLKTTTACKGYYGTTSDVGCNEIVNVMPNGYGFVTEKDGSLVVSYLVEAGARIKLSEIPDSVHDTLPEAITNVDELYNDVGAIVMLDSFTVCPVIPSGLTITLDLNGKTITCSDESTSGIQNYGALVVKDSSTGGMIQSNSWHGAYNEGTLTIQSGKLKGNKYGINNKGTLTVSGGTVEGLEYGIYNEKNSTSAVTISGGTIKATGTYASNITYAIYSVTGTVSISNGTIEAPKGIHSVGPLNISGGTITASSYHAISSSGTTTISGGTISTTAGSTESLNSSNVYAIHINNGSLTMSGGSVSGYRGISVASGKTLNINGGTITGNSGLGILNAGTINMTNGKVKGATSGINTSSTVNISGGKVEGTNSTGYAIQITSVAGNVTISKGDSAVGTYIYSPYYTIYNQKGTLVVNGGVVGQKEDGTTASRGIQNGLNGTNNSKGTTINGGKVIGTAYGISNSWGSLAITGGEVIASGASGQGINNNVNSTLTISGGTVEGKSYGIYSVATSENAITISGGTIKATGTYASDVTLAITSTAGTTSISGNPVIEGPKGIYVGEGATLNMSGGSITSSSYIALFTYGTTTISGGTIKAPQVEKEILNNYENYGISVRGGTLTLSGTVSIEGYYGLVVWGSANLNMSGGTIKGTHAFGLNNDGTTNVSGGTIEGVSEGIHNTGTLTINSGRISGTIGITSSYVVEINGGEISGSNYGIQNSSTMATAVTINNGVITGTTRGISSGAGTIKIVNGTVTGTTRGIHISGGTLNVSGGNVTGTNENGIWNAAATVNVSGGAIIGKSYAIGNTGTLNVEETSGKTITITGGSRGISTTGTVVVKSGTISGGNEGIATAGSLTISGGTIYTPTSEKYGIYNINDNGLLTITGGVVASNAGSAIYNVATKTNGVTISGGTIGEVIVGGTTYSSVNGVLNAANAKVTVTGGTIKGTTAGIDNSGIASVSGGTINGATALTNSKTLNVNGGTISGTNYGISNSGNLTMTGGEISTTTLTGGIGITNSGTATIDQGEGKTTKVSGRNKGVYNTGTLEVKAGEVSAAENVGTGKLTVSGGKVSGYGYGITNSSSSNAAVVVTGGIVSSTNASGTETGAIKTSAGKVIIGSSGGTPSSSSPVIESAGGFGIYETNKAAKVEVYDGIIKGKYSSNLTATTACKGYDSRNNDKLDVGCNEIVDVMPSGYGFIVEYDTTNKVTSQYLVEAGARIERSDPDTVETTIQAAINKVENYYSGIGTIYLLKDSNENVSIKAGLNIILNLNSKNWSCSTENTPTISNSGALTIEGTGTVESTAYYGIYNSGTGTLLIKSGTILGKQFAIRNISTSNSAVEIRGGIVKSTSTDAYSGLYISAGTATINGGLIEGFRGIFSEGSTTVVNITGGEVKGNNSYGVYNATSATLNVSGGKITGVDAIDNFLSAKVHVTEGTLEGTTLGIYNSSNVEDAVEISGGTIIGGEYALKTYYGHVAYTGGTLKGSTSKEYVYYMASGVTYSTGTKSEYTVIEGSQYVTTLVDAIEGSTDGTIKSKISSITSNGEVKLVGNMTEASIEIPQGKKITLDLNGNLLNSYISQRVATAKDSTPFIKVKGELTIVGGSIEMYNELADLIYVEENGILNIGRSSDSLSGAAPSLEVKDADGKNVVHGQEWSRVNYNNGVIKNGIDKFNVQYNDLYIREEYYIEHTANEMKLIADLDGSKPLELEPLYNNAEAANGEVKITINHESKEMGDNEEFIVYLRGKVTEEEPRGKEELLECTSIGYNTTCTIAEDKIGYVYNAIYEDKLLYVYKMETEFNRLKVLRDDLEIIPNLKNTSGYTKDPILSLETNADSSEPGKRYDILSDGEILLIDLLDGISDFSLLDINHSEVKTAIFGDNWNEVYDELNIELNLVERGMNNLTSGYVTISYASIDIINRTELNDRYEIPDGYTLANESSPKILIYDHSPKVDNSAAGAASLVTCEYGSACDVNELSFYDYLGNEIREVNTIITRDGEVVESIDTNVLGTYVVTTTATDMFGYTSLPVVQEYVVKDNVAPVLKVSEEAIIVNKGSLINDLDEVEISDNYDKVLMVERIDSEIDVNKAGTYKLGYRVVDSNGNETIVYRDVIVKEVSNSNVWIWYVIGITLLLGAIGIVSFMYIRKRK